MKRGKNRKFLYTLILRIIYTIALLSLLWYMIIPNSRIYYKKPDFFPFFKRLNTRDLIMTPGEEFKLRVQNINIRVKFSSLDIKVAGVTPFGTVIALRPGKTYINVKYNNNKLRCRVRVIDLNKKKINISPNEKYKLKVKGKAFFQRVKWSSSSPEVAKVDKRGRVIGISKGKTVITAKTSKKTLKCTVIVN